MMYGSQFKYIGGVAHKLCTGPAHEQPTYLPATEKYYYFKKTGKREGQLVSRCRLCCNWDRLKSPGSEQGYVPIRDAYPFYYEAINRIGLMELSRRSGLSPNGISNVMARRQNFVQKRNLRKVMLELISIKRKNEYSISIYSKWRNERRAAGGHHRCTGCGCVEYTKNEPSYTEGCGQCWERRSSRLARAA
jgi:hypothetical protein